MRKLEEFANSYAHMGVEERRTRLALIILELANNEPRAGRRGGAVAGATTWATRLELDIDPPIQKPV